MIELVFSFFFSTWTGLAEIHAWADEHMGGSASLTTEIKREAQILCALEHSRLLVYDHQWKKLPQLEVPAVCREGHLKGADIKSLSEVEFQSQTLSGMPKYSAWDHRADVKVKGQPDFTLFFRQDKKYIGAHSTTGWSLWVERKTGLIRFEHISSIDKSHFRMKVRADINPLKGELKAVHSAYALHAQQEKGKLQKAYIISGTKKDGFNHIVMSRLGLEWKKVLHKCEGAKNCRDSEIQTDEQKLTQFVDVSSEKFSDFIANGRALAFEKINADELVPETALYR